MGKSDPNAISKWLLCHLCLCFRCSSLVSEPATKKPKLDEEQQGDSDRESVVSEDAVNVDVIAEKLISSIKRKLKSSGSFYQEFLSFTVNPKLLRPALLSNSADNISQFQFCSTDHDCHISDLSSIRSTYRKSIKYGDLLTTVDIKNCVIQAARLVNYLLIWRWLKTRALSLLTLAVDTVDTTPVLHSPLQPWAKQLVSQLNRILLTQQGPGPVSIRHADIFGNSSVKSTSRITLTNQDLLVVGEEKKRVVLFHATRVLAEWIGLMDGKERPLNFWDSRGEFLYMVLREGGLGMLLLPCVTRACYKPIGFLMKHSSDFNLAQITSNVKVLLASKKHFDRTLSSLELCLLTSYPQLSTFSTISLDAMYSTLSVSQQNTDAMRISTVHADNDDGESEIVPHPRTHMLQNPSSTLQSIPVHHISPDAITGAVDKLLAFWVDLSRYPNKTQSSKALRWASDAPDKRIPARNSAPSRRSILDSPVSPYRKAVVFSRASLFSIIIFRAVTFGTIFVTQMGEVWFDTLQDFQDRISGLEFREICDPCVYGTYSSSHLPKHAPHFWEKSLTLFKWFQRQGRQQKNFAAVRNELQKITHIGPLTSYLIAADLAEAGLVDQPDGNSFAKMVLLLEKGAVYTLRDHFHIIHGEKKTLECAENVKVFLTVLTQLQEAVLRSSCERKLSLFDFEHLLCKFNRFQKP